MEKFRKKFGKSLEILEILEIWKFRTFRKLRKNDVKLQLRKSQKTCSDSKTNLKVWLKVRNAGPYSCIARCAKTSDRPKFGSVPVPVKISVHRLSFSAETEIINLARTETGILVDHY